MEGHVYGSEVDGHNNGNVPIPLVMFELHTALIEGGANTISHLGRRFVGTNHR